MRRITCLLLLTLLLTACKEKPPAVQRDQSLNKAEQAVKKQDYEAALKHIGEAIRIEPKQPYLQLRRGDILFLAERYPEALDAYTKAYELNKRSAEAALGAGMSLARMDQDAEAEARYAIADRLFSERVSNPPDRERYSEEYIEEATIHAKLHLALISTLRGQKPAALRQIDMIAQAHPDWEEAERWRAVIENNALEKLISGEL